MKTVIVIANPKPTSFNHAIADSVIKGLEEVEKEYEIWDLNKMKFNPVISQGEFEKFGYAEYDPNLEHFIEVLTNECDQIVLIYPIIFFEMPAILKGFFDRVFIGTLIQEGGNPVDWKPSINIEKTFIIETSLGDMWSIATNQNKKQNEALTAQVMRKIGLFNPIIETYKNLGKSTLEERQQFLELIQKQFSKFDV
ncbi:NAD(P)H-dependent oxidoreductase [Spiroplasma diminutum]|uniref:NADPH dehydrogenase n=1 Tax=Spiroplasma diminutum CUAS-1 TaxID=1276221 RepID=S5M2D2_9MOLU|nr:NAD(P)H-dependent oxidoreductase [Spiroplasma diminutum]AGR42227.1 NADPH dehydrogenase [Spiroplasma diminutum CUAS-1]